MVTCTDEETDDRENGPESRRENGEAGGPRTRHSATSYMIVNRPCREEAPADRPSIPPMVMQRPDLSSTPEKEGRQERFTADLTDPVQAVADARQEMLPEDLFFCLYARLHAQFREELSRDPGFFRVKYFVPSPPNMVPTFGRYSPIYNERFADVSWQELQSTILQVSVVNQGDDRPRGIHFVHEPDDEGRETAGAPPCSIDVSLDGRGSIMEATAEIELWWSFGIVHTGVEHARTSLRYASNLLCAYVKCLERISETLGYPLAPDCSLLDFFFLLNAARTSDPDNHDVDFEALPLGQCLYEFMGRARFAGRDLEVEVMDSTGYVDRVARTVVDESRRVNIPLKGFSVGIRGDLNTVTFERRFTDQRRSRRT